MRLQTALPSFCTEFDAALLDREDTHVRQQLASLEITARCECDLPNCATFHVAPSRDLNEVEQKVIAMYYAGHDINHFRQLESIRRSTEHRTSERRAREQGDEAGEAR